MAKHSHPIAKPLAGNKGPTDHEDISISERTEKSAPRRHRTLIGVLASHDSVEKNDALRGIFEELHSTPKGRQLLKQFSFVFTGGTYRRLFDGDKIPALKSVSKKASYLLEPKTRQFLCGSCGVIRLPPTEKGGVILLANLITSRQVSILWPFFTPRTTHLLFPENLALLRLADQWRVKKLMNSGSVREWFRAEAERDANLNRQDPRLQIRFRSQETGGYSARSPHSGYYYISTPESSSFPDFVSARDNDTLPELLSESVVALISHDEMKGRMLDFVIDYETELSMFRHILATGTTGKLVGEAAPRLQEKIIPYHSGPKGGDVEIATEILFGRCHVVIFFVDPLHAHPHAEDIRVVFGACMIQDQVRMLSNEVQARDWMNHVIRGR